VFYNREILYSLWLYFWKFSEFYVIKRVHGMRGVIAEDFQSAGGGFKNGEAPRFISLAIEGKALFIVKKSKDFVLWPKITD
jgi:hypothetical protein